MYTWERFAYMGTVLPYTLVYRRTVLSVNVIHVIRIGNMVKIFTDYIYNYLHLRYSSYVKFCDWRDDLL